MTFVSRAPRSLQLSDLHKLPPVLDLDYIASMAIFTKSPLSKMTGDRTCIHDNVLKVPLNDEPTGRGETSAQSIILRVNHYPALVLVKMLFKVVLGSLPAGLALSIFLALLTFLYLRTSPNPSICYSALQFLHSQPEHRRIMD